MIPMLRKSLLVALCGITVAGLSGIAKNALGGGFTIPHQSARALGLSNAMTAGVNDPSAVYYNPAALSEVDGNVVLINGSYINVINNVENSGRKSVNKHDDNFLATLFGNYHIPESDFTIGLGAYTPFGLATTYDRAFTRFAAQHTELKTIYVTPSVSWHPAKQISVGAGLSFVHASGVFTRQLCFDSAACTAVVGSPAEAHLRLTDTQNAFTYNLGVLIKPTDTVKLGFSYRARADIRFKDAEVKLGGPAFAANPTTNADVRPLPLPPVINVGAFWQITPEWGSELVYEFTRWSEFKSFKANFSPIPLFFGFAPVPGFNLPEDWKDTSSVRFGSFYAINKSWEVRGGLSYDGGPSPNKTLNPSIPGGDSITLNAGVGYKWDRFGIDAGYMAVFYRTRRVTNNELEGIPATGIPYNGAPGKDKYETFNNFLSLSASYRF